MELKEFEADTSAARSRAELWDVAVEFFTGAGYASVSYHHFGYPGHPPGDPGGPTMVGHGYPEAWVKRYLDDKLYLVDPFPQVAASRSAPFRWSQVRTHAVLNDASLAYLQMRQQHGLGDGISIHVTGSNGRNGCVGLGFGDTVNSALSTQTAVRTAQFAAQIAHLRYCQLTDNGQRHDFGLSPREREILLWILQGKGNGVIAEILGLSTHTVDTVVRRIFRKLDVSDRVTAALKAQGRGLIAGYTVASADEPAQPKVVTHVRDFS